MINNDNDNSTDTVTNELKTKSFNENNEKTMPSTVSVSNSTGEEQPVHTNNNDQCNGVKENDQNNGVKEHDQNNGVIDNESQDKQLVVTQEQQQEGNNDDDEFIRITAAHQMLTEGKSEHLFFNKLKIFFSF